jgi:hypothetical protein
MEHCGFIVEVKDLRKHENADKLQIATFFRNDVCVGLDTQVGDKGVFFPCDLQLSLEFCEKNNLLRVLPDGTKGPGYMDPDKRNVKAIRLRGEKSSGIYLPITCLEYTGVDLNSLNPGDPVSTINGVEICKKYIPARQHATSAGGAGSRTARRAKRTVAPTFFEHKDTEQLDYNLSAFKPGDEIEITLKIHGTSQRTANVPVLQENRFSLADNEFKSILIKLMPKGKWKDRLIEKWCNPVYDYSTISGTRRTVMDTFEGGFYGSNEFREQYHEFFKDKLWKGETVYYEVAGFTHTGQPIMATVSNKGVNDKNFVKMYGEKTTFSYGCYPNGLPEQRSHMWVYRMTMTNPDGQVVEYTPDFMRYRCEQMAVDCVPLLWKGIIPEHPASKDDDTISAGEWIANKADMYNDGPDPIDPRHVREGVVVRILNRPTFTAYKSKNHNFKVIEGIAKEVAEAPDMEEADGLDVGAEEADV